MAKVNLIRGGFINTIGVVTGAKWHSFSIIKTKPIPTNPDTILQKDVRTVFGMLNNFFAKFAPSISEYTNLSKKDMSVRNALVRLNKDLVRYSLGTSYNFFLSKVKYQNILLTKPDIDFPYTIDNRTDKTVPLKFGNYLKYDFLGSGLPSSFKTNISDVKIGLAQNMFVSDEVYTVAIPFYITYKKNKTTDALIIDSFKSANFNNTVIQKWAVSDTDPNEMVASLGNYPLRIAAIENDDPKTFLPCLYMYFISKKDNVKHATDTVLFYAEPYEYDATASTPGYPIEARPCHFYYCRF